jgi:hypothetical protein
LPGEGPVIVDAKAYVENMIKKYSVGFEDSARDSHATLEGHSGGDHAVVLTGSTGGIGSYLLASFATARGRVRGICFQSTINSVIHPTTTEKYI